MFSAHSVTAVGRLCEFDVVPVSRQKQIRWMAQRQLSGAYSHRQSPANCGHSVTEELDVVNGW